MQTNNLFLRISTFIFGLFIMAFGVSLSVKANLGVSPISCIPYIYSLKLPFTMGELTILFNLILIVFQVILLRKDYKLIQLIQLPVVFLFGYFIDFTLVMVTNLDASNYGSQIFWCLMGCIVVAFGVFLEIKASLTYLPGEGLAKAIADTLEKEFGKAKISVDSSMVIIGIISSFILLQGLKGVREGTFAAAILVGFLAKFYSNKLQFVDNWLGNISEE